MSEMIDGLAKARRQALDDATTLRDIADRYTNDDPANTFNHAPHAKNLHATADWCARLAAVITSSLDGLNTTR